jgi:hypothetical protein
MPEKLPCPGCGRRVTIPDHLLQKPVKCPACRKVFTFGAVEEEETPPPQSRATAVSRRPAKSPPPLDEDDAEETPVPARRPGPPPLDDGDEDEEEEKPARSRRAAPPPLEEEEEENEEDEEDEEEDEKPARSRRGKRRRDEDEDEDEDEEDEDDDRPSRRKKLRKSKKKKSKKGSYKPLHVAGWRQVKDGLMKAIIGLFIALGTGVLVSVVQGIATFVLGLSVATTAYTGKQVLSFGAGLVLWNLAYVLGCLGATGGLVMLMLGLKQCREAPHKNKCQQMATWASNLALGGVIAGGISSGLALVMLILGIMEVYGGSWIMAWIFGLAVSALVLLGTGTLVCLALFLRGTAQNVYEPKHAQQFLVLAIALGVVGGLGFGGAALDSFGGLDFLADLGSLSFFGEGVLPLGVGGWLVAALFMSRNFIQTYLDGEADPRKRE